MFKVKIFDKIATEGIEIFPNGHYSVNHDHTTPDAIFLRSHRLEESSIDNQILAIARAGAGTNNIPIKAMTQRGIPVFNTPGANANAVKELVLGAMLLGCRNICQSWQFVQNCHDYSGDLAHHIETEKKQFVGFELPGKTLTVIGLGAIGVKVANSARQLGMNVIGYDPGLTVASAWKLSSTIKHASDLKQAISQADFVSLHVPYLDSTHHLINENNLNLFKTGAILLNFARTEIVDNKALLHTLKTNKIRAYLCDFPNKDMLGHPKVIALPHLGASTHEAQVNCAVMAAKQLRDYLEFGTINNSVNFPTTNLHQTTRHRLTIVNNNVPNMVGQISTLLANRRLNITDLLNKSQEDIAYNIIDLNDSINESLIAELQNIEGVIKVRQIGFIG